MKAREIYKVLFEAKKTDAPTLEREAVLGAKTVSKAIARDTGLSPATAQKIVARYPDISLQWLLTGEGEMFNSPQTTDTGLVNEPPYQYVKAPNGKVPRRTNGDSSVPFYEADFEAGGGVAFYEDIRSSVPAYFMDVPEFAGCTAFRTYGKSMQPLIDSGAILFGSEEKHWQEHGIEYGQIFGIVLKPLDGVTKRLLKVVRRSIENPKSHFRLESKNPAFDDMELDKSLIKSMWLIHGWINKNT